MNGHVFRVVSTDVLAHILSFLPYQYGCDMFHPPLHCVNHQWYRAIRVSPFTLLINDMKTNKRLFTAGVTRALQWFTAIRRLQLCVNTSDLRTCLVVAARLPIITLDVLNHNNDDDALSRIAHLLPSLLQSLPHLLHMTIPAIRPRVIHAIESAIASRHGATLLSSSFGTCHTCHTSSRWMYRCRAGVTQCNWRMIQQCADCITVRDCINTAYHQLNHMEMVHHWHDTDVSLRCMPSYTCTTCIHNHQSGVDDKEEEAVAPSYFGAAVPAAIPRSVAERPYCGTCMRCTYPDCNDSVCDTHMGMLLYDILAFD